jgi:hypothetical protein
VTIRWFTDEDRERMRREAADAAEIGAEYDRICMKYARIASREPIPVDLDMFGRLDIRPWPEP